VGNPVSLLLAAAALMALTATAAGASPASRACTGAMLSGTFTAIPGSAGAGNIVYRLRLKNTSPTACFVTGRPVVRLLDASGRALPTKPTFVGAQQMMPVAVKISLSPASGTATLTARFSPDIPGPGEPVTGPQCERTAHKLRVHLRGGGTVIAPISPPTPVCEHGDLQLTDLRRG
jgi:hypothetical protein